MSKVSAHLYDIARSFKGLEDLVESGEVSFEDAADTFEAIEGDFTQKVTQILAMRKNYEAFATAAATEKARMAAMEATAKARAEWLKNYIASQMQRIGMKSIKTLHGTVNIQDGPGSVVIEDLLKIPTEYLDYNPEAAYTPRKKDIKDAIERGEEIPGARVEPGGVMIRITQPRGKSAAPEQE